MPDIHVFRQLALAFPNTSEEPHFEKTSFRIGKKIFATLDTTTLVACLKLPLAEQDVFSLHDTEAIYPVPNAWGKHGWTFVNLNKVRTDVLEDALRIAYAEVTAKKPKKQK